MRGCKKWLGALSCSVLTVAAFSPAIANATDYPNAPVTVVVGYPAGGPADMAARIITEELSKRWEQPVIVESKPGANATIATTDVSRAANDGYRLLLAAGNHTTNKFVYKDLRYDVEKSFTPIAMISQAPTVLATSVSFQADTVEDVLKLLRESPGKYNYSSTGYGSTSHLAAELFKQQTDTSIQHIPYKGVGQAAADIIGGNIDMVFASLGSVKAYFDSGKLKPIALATPERLAELPDVPTFAEAGLSGYEVQTWYGLLAPAGTDKAIIDKINRDVNSILEDPEIKQKLLSQGGYAAPHTPEEFAQRLQFELQRMEKLSAAVDLGFGK